MWDMDSMVRAVTTLRDNEMDILKTSKKFSVSRATLKDYVNSRDKEAKALVAVRMERNPLLPVKLVNYYLLMEITFF
jgi:hypothetical protein